MIVTIENFEEGMNDHLEKMIYDVGEENFGKARVYDYLKSDLEQQLYAECHNITKLLAT